MARALASVLAAGLVLGAAAPATAKVTVTLWTSGVSPATLSQMATAVNRALPSVELHAVDFPPARYDQALRRAASSRLLPDIVGVTPGAETQMLRGSVIRLDAIAVDALGKRWQTHYPAALLDEARLGNPPGRAGFFMLPMTTGVDGLWIAPRAATKAHVTEAPTKIGELEQTADRLQKAGMTPLVLGGKSDEALVGLFLQIAAGQDAALVRPAAQGEAVWTKPPMLAAAKVWTELFTHAVVPAQALDMSEKQARDDYAKGHAGMIAAGSGLLALARTNSGQPVGQFFAFPATPPSATPAPPVGGISLGWAITDAATGEGKVKVATSLVLRELVAGSAAQVAVDRLAGFPAWNGLAPDIPPPPADLGLYRRLSAEVPRALPDVIGNPAVEHILAGQLRLLAEQKVTANAAMEVVNRAAKRGQELAE